MGHFEDLKATAYHVRKAACLFLHGIFLHSFIVLPELVKSTKLLLQESEAAISEKKLAQSDKEQLHPLGKRQKIVSEKAEGATSSHQEVSNQ